MPIVIYHALDADECPFVVERLTLQEALDLATTHLASGVTPVAFELDGHRFDTMMILMLLDVRREREHGK